MTLEHLLQKTAEYGIGKRVINYSAAGSSIADLNNKSIREYPILFTAPTGSHSVTRDTTEYTVTLYYIDRLEEDSSNDIAIYSTSIEQLKNIINGLREIDGIVDIDEEYSIENFVDTEALSDRCAGAYTTINIMVANDVICPDDDAAKINEWLFNKNYVTLDWDYAYEYFERSFPVSTGGCSAFRDGDLIARNFDYKYDWEASFLVRTPRTIGIAGGLENLTISKVESGLSADEKRIIPFFLQDGINEGLYMEMNLVPAAGNSVIEPVYEQTDRVCTIMLVRYCLEHYSSVDELVEGLKSLEIFNPTGLTEQGYEIHYMAADDDHTVVIEFVDGEIKVVESEKSTNFRLYGVDFEADGSVFTPKTAEKGMFATSQGIEAYGTGLERWNMLLGKHPANKNEMFEVMRSLNFSNAYADEGWASEFVGGDINVDTPADNEDFKARIEEYKGYFKDKNRDNPTVWITTHTSVYDLRKKCLWVSMQEKNSEIMRML